MVEAAILVIFPFCMVYSAISDTLTMTIANRVSLILIASFALLAPLTGMAWGDFGMHFAAGFCTLLVTMAMFAIGAMGGGDSKLMSATALWVGFSPLMVEYLLNAAVFGGFLTLTILIFRNSALSLVGSRLEFLRRIGDPKEGIPYGIALGAAGLMIFPEVPMMQWVLASLAAL